MSKAGTISDALPRPDHNYVRARELIESPRKKIPADLPQWSTCLVAEARAENIETEALRMALHIANRPAQRIPLESFLFSGASPEEIAEVLEIGNDVVDAFRELFFDMAAALPSKLEKIDYIDMLAIAASDIEAADHKQRVYEHDLKKAGFYLGPSYLKWQFSPEGIADADVTHMLEIASTDMFIRGMAHRLSPVDSNGARAARECYTLLTKAAGALKVMRKGDDPSAVDAILMLLKTGPTDRDASLMAPEGVTAADLDEDTAEED